MEVGAYTCQDDWTSHVLDGTQVDRLDYTKKEFDAISKMKWRSISRYEVAYRNVSLIRECAWL